MTETRLRLTPSEFGALWTTLKAEPKLVSLLGFDRNPNTIKPHSWMFWNHIELIEEYDPDYRPRWENGKLTVDPIFRTWADCLGEDDPLLEALK